jgi:hypothetical protein
MPYGQDPVVSTGGYGKDPVVSTGGYGKDPAVKEDSDVWDIHPVEALLHEGLIPNFFAGVNRLVGKDFSSTADNIERAAGNLVNTVSNLQVPTLDEFVHGSQSAVHNFISDAYNHPKHAVSSLVNSIAADPWLLIPGVGEFGLPAKGTSIGAYLGEKAGSEILQRTAPVIGRGLGDVAAGVAAGGLIEGGQQFKTGEFNPNAIANAMEFGGVLGTAKAALGGVKSLRDTPKSSAEPIKDVPVGSPLNVSEAESILKGPASELAGFKGEVEPVAPGKTRLYFTPGEILKDPEFKKGEYKGKWLLRLSEDKDKALQKYMDIPNEELGTLVKHFEGNQHDGYFVESKRVKAETKPLGGLKEGFVEDILKKNISSNPLKPNEKILSVIKKHGPAAAATGAIVAAISLMLPDSPWQKELPKALAVGGLAGLFVLFNKISTGNKAVSETIADLADLGADAQQVARNFELGQNALLSKEEQAAILDSFDPDKHVVLNERQAIVKAAFVKNLNNTYRAAQAAGIKGIEKELFFDALPLKIKNEAGRTISKKEFSPSKAKTSATEDDIVIEKASDIIKEFLEATGGEIKTKTPADVYKAVVVKTYERALRQELANVLKKYPDPRLNIPYVMEMPKGKTSFAGMDNYEKLNNARELTGKYVLKDIAPAVKALYAPGGFEHPVLNLLLGLSSAMKRAAVSLTFFHLKTLTDGLIGTDLKYINPYEIRRGFERGYNALIGKENNEQIRFGIRNGLRVGAVPIDLEPEEMNKLLFRIVSPIDKVIPGNFGQKIAGKIADYSHAIDMVTFGLAMNGFKSVVYLDKFETLAKALPEEAAAKVAAAYANATFGGQNFFRLVNASNNAVMRNFGNMVITGSGMGLLRIFTFAPDWIASTLQGTLKALPGMTSKELQKLHAMYVLRSAVFTLTLANIINYTLVGHSTFENHDPTRIELTRGPGKPATAMIAKHFFEGPEFVAYPFRKLLSSTNPMVQMPFELLTNQQYLSTTGNAPAIVRPSDTELEQVLHMAKQIFSPFVPIGLQQITNPGRTMLGAIGVPVVGGDVSSQAENRQKAILDRIAKRQTYSESVGPSLNSQVIGNLLQKLGLK